MKLAIVNDSENHIEILRRIVEPLSEFTILWIARGGEEALKKYLNDKPDLILMDLHMPGMNGVETTKRIMAIKACTIMITTTSVDNSTSLVFEAMGNGAVDAVSIPATADDGTLTGEDVFVKKLHIIRKLINPSTTKETALPAQCCGPGLDSPYLIAIGASTGGPKALSEILNNLPPDLPAAIAIVQHVDAKFSKGLVTWLSEQSKLPVRIATEGDVINRSNVYVASTDQHLILRSDCRLGYTAGIKSNPYQPSVDVFFNSLVQWKQKGTAVLLTGMGRDGAQGMLTLKANGWHTIAQNKESCIVFGMPKAAIELNAVEFTLPLQNIASHLVQTIQANSLSFRGDTTTHD